MCSQIWRIDCAPRLLWRRRQNSMLGSVFKAFLVLFLAIVALLAVVQWISGSFRSHHLSASLSIYTLGPNFFLVYDPSLGGLAFFSYLSVTRDDSSWIPSLKTMNRPEPKKNAHVLGIPCWCLLLPVTFVGAQKLMHRRRGAPHGSCANCSYDLTGNVSGICPECGTLLDTDMSQRARGGSRENDTS
jgi:hypothetical protein